MFVPVVQAGFQDRDCLTSVCLRVNPTRQYNEALFAISHAGCCSMRDYWCVHVLHPTTGPESVDGAFYHNSPDR
jgi:hypothetical protein